MPRQRSAPSRAPAAASRPRPAASSTPAPASAPRPQAYPTSAPAPVPHASAPPPAVPSSGGGGLLSGLMGSVVTGVAMGTGSAIAHRAVDSMLGPRETKVVHEHQGAPEPAPVAQMMSAPTSDGPCGERVKAFAECMSRNSGDMGACQFYFDSMQQCKTMAA